MIGHDKNIDFASCWLVLWFAFQTRLPQRSSELAGWRLALARPCTFEIGVFQLKALWVLRRSAWMQTCVYHLYSQEVAIALASQ